MPDSIPVVFSQCIANDPPESLSNESKETTTTYTGRRTDTRMHRLTRTCARTHRHTTHIESELVIKDRQLDDIRVGGL